MGIKTYGPYTPSRRNVTSVDNAEITKSTPEKSLVVSLKKNAGRNNQGKITVRHRGGGSRRKYRIIDFKRNSKDGIPATVIGIEYDPNRTANIALICYADGEKAYILAPEGLTDGMKVMNGPEAEVRVGNCLPLSAIPVGTQVHNVELHPGKGGQLVRSAGNGAQLMAKEGKYATLRLPSGEMRMVPLECRATVGIVGNMLPIPALILLTRHIIDWLKKHGILVRFTGWLERKGAAKAKTVQRYSFWGLFILVAIPLPGTGAWTGALVASLLDMRLKRALPAITMGVIAAGIIVLLLTYGVISVGTMA